MMRGAPLLLLIVLNSLTLSGCAWDFPDHTKKMIAEGEAARRIEVTREDLPKGSYQALGWVSSLRMPPPCDKSDVAEDAYAKFGSKVDEVIRYDGGDGVGSGFYNGCRGLAIHKINTTSVSN